LDRLAHALDQDSRCDRPVLGWFLGAVKKAYPILTGPGYTGGERIAAFGSVVFALGVLVTVVGLVAWAG
jgi:hypothetical protein